MPEHLTIFVKANGEPDLIQKDDKIPYVPRTRSGEALSSLDGQHMQYYWCTSGRWFDLINDNMSDSENPLALCIARRFGAHICSKPVRFAILFYSSFRKEGGKVSYVGMEYLGQFYGSAQDAIGRQSYAELVYACYAMCLYEIVSKRLCSEEFGKHANGFLISYQNLVKTETLTGEEQKLMSNAHFMISQARNITSSRWHVDENWFEFAETCIQRLESAGSRLLKSSKTIGDSNEDVSGWIPKSHHLFEAEGCVYTLYSLFETLSAISKDGRREFESLLGGEIHFYLNKLIGIVSKPACLAAGTPTSGYVLKDGKTTVLGDRLTRQLLCLYYIFELQYRILVEDWSDFNVKEVLQTSLAVCRLVPSPHESTLPGPEIRFVFNRGSFFAGIAAVEARNLKSPFQFSI